MNFNIHKALIKDLIVEASKTKCMGSSSLEGLNQIVDCYTGDIPITVLNQNLTITKLENLEIPIEDPLSISQITSLYDSTFLINTPNKQLAHYDENFNLIQYLPIDEPLLHSEIKVVENYIDPQDNSVSLIFVSYPTEHIIRIYKYKYKSVIELVSTIGTQGSAGVSLDLLESPLHLAILQSTDCLKLFVFNDASIKVIKEFSIVYNSLTPTITDLGVTSTDASNLLGLSNQDLVSVTCMDIYEDKLFLSSTSDDVWGFYQVSSLNSSTPSLLNIIFSKNTPLKNLDHKDLLTYPTSFYYSSSLQYFIISDAKGHIVSLDYKTFKVRDYFGVPSDPDTLYPNHFFDIKSVFIKNNTLFFIDRSRLLSSNFFKLLYSADSVYINSPATDTYIKDIVGVNENLLDIQGENLSIDLKNYTKVPIPSNSSLRFIFTTQPEKFVVIFGII